MKVKFKCNKCGETYYNYIVTNKRKVATKYKKMFKDDNDMIHEIFEGGCKKRI